MKGKVKSIAIFLVLIMVFNIFAPAISVIATVSGNVTINFGGPWDVEGVTVDCTNRNGTVTIDADEEITLSNFNAEKMKVYIEASDGFKADLTVTDGKTKISTANCDGFPSGKTLEFKVAPKGGGNPPQQGGNNQGGSTASSGFSVKLSGAGKVWYKFGTESEIEVTSDKQDIQLTAGSMTIRVENKTINTAFLFVNGQQQNVEKDRFKTETGYTFNVKETDNVSFEIEYISGNDENNGGEDNPTPPQPGNTQRTINVSSTGMDSYVYISDRYIDNPNDPNAVVFAGVVTEQGQNTNTFRQVADKYYIHVKPDAINGGRITSIKINGVSQTIQNSIGMNYYEVSPADIYNIEVVGEKEIRYKIMWANDGADVAGTDYDNNEVKLKNGSAKVVKVYDNETNMNEITDKIEHSDEGCLNPQGRGYVELAQGNVVIFEFEPKYGYQLTSVSANGTKLEPQDTINQYKYVMPNTNIHFKATFTKTDDIVKAESKQVSSGEISLGNTLKGGTAQLTVNDVELSQDQITGFENAAGDYTISNYLDIDLYNVFYKGTSDISDKDDVWSNKISELDNKATITLKLAEGVNADEIVIVHNIHDGDEYEVIQIDNYDPVTNTITFKTKSFSNYAIATKASSNIEEEVCTHSLTFVEKVSATCEKDGTKAHYKCSNCGKTFDDGTARVEVTLESLVIKAGHDWGEWVVTKEATTTEKGEKTRTCKKDSSHTETQEIPKSSSNTPSTDTPSTDTPSTDTPSIDTPSIDTPSTEPVVNVAPDKNTSETNQATVEATKLIKTILNGNDVEGIDKNLASEIITAINRGKTIKIELATDKIDEKSIENDAKKVKDYIAKDTKIGAYYDIDVIAKIDGVEKGTITKLNNAIKITLPLPTDLPKIEDGYTRQYTIIRIHDGVAESIATSIENNKIVFNTDKFSTYALTYRDIENTNTETNTTEGTNEEKNKTPNETSSNPKTGDPIKLYISLLAISLLGFVTTRKMDKNSKSSKH